LQTPYRIPGAMKAKDGSLDILQKRYAVGEITTEDSMSEKKF